MANMVTIICPLRGKEKLVIYNNNKNGEYITENYRSSIQFIG
jgi:hypothetical protein